MTNSVTSFFNIDKLYELAQSTPPTMTAIPQGVKQNVYFVIDDTNNRKRRLLKKCSDYSDDCGSWESAKNSTKAMYFIRSSIGTLHYIECRAGIYGKRSKKTFVPFDPQPDPSTILIGYRKYSTLARNSSYKKRVTWFNCEPVIATAIVEYIGE